MAIKSYSEASGATLPNPEWRFRIDEIDAETSFDDETQLPPEQAPDFYCMALGIDEGAVEGIVLQQFANLDGSIQYVRIGRFRCSGCGEYRTRTISRDAMFDTSLTLFDEVELGRSASVCESWRFLHHDSTSQACSCGDANRVGNRL